MTKPIQIDRDVIAWLKARQQPGEPLGETVRRELAVTAVDLDDETYAFLLTRATSIGESASEILRRELDIGEGSPGEHAGPNVVEFRIPVGTGSGPWNTRLNKVVATVGDTLRIVNDDSVAHRPHSGPEAPFPHPAQDILPGGAAEFPHLVAFPGNQPLWDHDFGEAAEFWITVQDPT